MLLLRAVPAETVPIVTHSEFPPPVLERLEGQALHAAEEVLSQSPDLDRQGRLPK